LACFIICFHVVVGEYRACYKVAGNNESRNFLADQNVWSELAAHSSPTFRLGFQRCPWPSRESRLGKRSQCYPAGTRLL